MRDIFDSIKIADVLNSKLIGENKKIEDITLNSKEQLNKTTCFFAIRGEKYDGNNFISEAVKNGAGLIVTNVKPNIEVPYILVDDTKIALGILGKHNKGGTKIVGITGSAGKTTTKEMIKALLSQKYNVYATRLNENNEIGVAKTLLRIKNHDFCIVEMGMRGLGEIRYLSSIAEPDISVITNAGTAHLERLGTKEEAEALYRELGVHFRSLSPWQVYVITSHPAFEKFYGKKADKIRKLYNGMLPCYLYQFFKN
jgi:UDP-N-acetylmuramoyl-tripeptide--D-alanyl-D-alanine ligase